MKISDLKYSINWILKQLKATITKKPVKGYKRVLAIKEIIRLGVLK